MGVSFIFTGLFLALLSVGLIKGWVPLRLGFRGILWTVLLAPLLGVLGVVLAASGIVLLAV